MKLIMIAAVSVDDVIGIDDDIPWHIPEDFKHFKNITMGNMLIVGATTFKTLPKKAHEGREFIILNSGERFDLPEPNYHQFSSLDTVLDLINNENINIDKVYVIGGASIYSALIDYCDEAVITWVDKKYPEGNKRFPITNLFANFDTYSETEWKMSKSKLGYKITKYQRKDDCPKKTNH